MEVNLNEKGVNNLKGDLDSVDNESLNSFKNAEIIAAAFSSNNTKQEKKIEKKVDLKQVDEIDNDESDTDDINSNVSISSTQANDNSLEQSQDQDQNDYQLSNQIVNIKNSNNDSDQDSLANTIAKVASGSITIDTNKLIESKRMKMIKIKSKKFLKSNNMNSNKFKKNTNSSSSTSDLNKNNLLILKKNFIKKRRHRRTKLEILNDTQKAAKAADDAISSVLSNLNNENTSSSTSTSLKKKLIFSKTNKIDNSLKSRKFKLIHKDIQRKRRFRNFSKNLKKEPKPELEQDEEETIEEQTINEFEPTEFSTIRKCIICCTKLDQDLLNEHYSKHFYQSSKCLKCDKISSNPANFVTHILTHLPSQFYCSTCKKWFRQPLVYRRHKQECNSKQNEFISTSTINTRQKRKSSLNEATSQTIKIESNVIEPKRRRAFSHKPEPEPEPMKTEPTTEVQKRRPGRPPKNQNKTDEKTFENEDKLETKKENSPESETKKEAEQPIKRKYEKKIVKPDLSKKERLRSFTHVKKYNENDSIVDLYLKSAFKKEKSVSSSSNNSSNNNNDNSNKIRLRSNTRQENSQNNNSKKVDSDYEDIKSEDEQTKSMSKISKDDNSSLDDRLNESEDHIVVSDIEMDESEINLNKEESNQNQNPKIEVVASTANQNLEQNTNTETILEPTKELTSYGTYKVKIQPRRGSSTTSSTNLNQQKQKENDKALSATPSKLTNNNTSNINTNSANSNGNNNINNNNNNNVKQQQQQENSTTTYFECPECDKKFVSYFGLVQHYDHHPTLAVNCVQCEIQFENHHALVLHNANVHNIIDNSLSLAKDKENYLNKKSESTSNLKTSINSNSSVKQLQSKTKSQLEDISQQINDSSNINSQQTSSSDLSSLPSIMTRTSRLGQQSILNTPTHKPTLLTSHQNTSTSTSSNNFNQTLTNHTLSVKTSGFADLSFIDFSCINFPRIAQNFCELWPRKLTNSISDALIQPLHNYKCDKCGFYFPCIASLHLHKMKKIFSTSKLIINQDILNNLESHLNQSLVNCKLFMTNSKYMDYEKSLEEIINKIEIEQEYKNKVDLENEKNKEEFLNWFDLVDVNKLSKPNNNSKTTNLAEALFLKLRSQMLDINHQFIIDLDRWKFIHSNESSESSNSVSDESNQYFNKIHLKPHVNLTRPLLIRSKKLKRNAQKFLIQQTKTNDLAKTNKSKPSQSIKNDINAISISLANKLTSQSSNPSLTLPTLLPPPPPPPPLPPVQQTTQLSKPVESNKPVFSKPFFSATSANFSAAVNLTNKKRKQEEKQKDVNNKLELNYDTICSNQTSEEEKETKPTQNESKRLTRNNLLNKRLKSEENSIDNYEYEPEEDELEDIEDEPDLEEEEDDELNEIETKKNNHSSSILLDIFKKNKPVKRLQHNPIKLKHELTKSNKQASNSNEVTKLNSNNLPTPPPLYKAPINHVTTFSSTSANSSRLTNASGMNNNLANIKNMPKLQPINSKQQPAPPQLPVMPKLKLHNNSNMLTNGIQNLPQLPKLLLGPNNNADSKTQSTLNGNINNNSHKSKIPAVVSTTAVGPSSASGFKPIAPKPPTANLTNNNENGNKLNNKNSENISLKCKFCMQIFKGQSEFFQHVIMSHPKMVKQKLNRGNSNNSNNNSASGTSSNNQGNSNNNNTNDISRSNIAQFANNSKNSFMN